MSTSYYIAGPMRGFPHFNFPAFDAVKHYLWAESIQNEVVSPADHDREMIPNIEYQPGYQDGDIKRFSKATGFDFAETMRWDLKQVADVDVIVLLPGWERSTGAGHERWMAEVCGKEILYAHLTENGACYEVSKRPQTTIVGLMGYAGAGKDTVGQILVEDYGYKRRAFADALRQVLLHLDPIVRYRGGGRRLDALLDEEEVWDKAKQTPEVRQLLQRLGVGVRQHVDEDAWVNAVERSLSPGKHYVITDVRFPNEIRWVRSKGGFLLRVDRQGHGPVNGHISEQAWTSTEPDAVVANTGTIEELGDKVAGTLTGLHLSRRDESLVRIV